MAVLDIVKYPDPRLSQVCKPVEKVDGAIRELVQNMIDTMYDAPGVGLAAPQVGHFIRLIVMDSATKEEASNLRILVNPELTLLGEVIKSEQEGCLSVPLNYRANVPRHSIVHLKAKDLDGNDIDEMLLDYEAIIIQHEFDHLNGILFIDHVSRLRRAMYDNKVKKHLR